jgi:hypothetical protein
MLAGAVALKKMLERNVGPFLVLKRAGIYGHAAWLVVKLCARLCRGEVARSWAFCVREAERR